MCCSCSDLKTDISKTKHKSRACLVPLSPVATVFGEEPGADKDERATFCGWSISLDDNHALNTRHQAGTSTPNLRGRCPLHMWERSGGGVSTAASNLGVPCGSGQEWQGPRRCGDGGDPRWWSELGGRLELGESRLELGERRRRRRRLLGPRRRRQKP